MAKLNKSFKKNPRYHHKRSEGLTRRGAARQERLMLGHRHSMVYTGARTCDLLRQGHFAHVDPCWAVQGAQPQESPCYVPAIVNKRYTIG